MVGRGGLQCVGVQELTLLKEMDAEEWQPRQHESFHVERAWKILQHLWQL